MERTLAALQFKNRDYVPVAGGLIQSAEFLAGMARAEDFWTSPRETTFKAFRALECDAMLGPVLPKPPETTTVSIDSQPTDFSKPRSEPKYKTPEDVASYARNCPSRGEKLRNFDLQGFYHAYVQMMRDRQEEAGEMLFIPQCLGYAPNFPTSDGIFTYEAFLMACALYTDSVKRLFEWWGAEAFARYEVVAQATLEHGLLQLIWTGTDLCDARGPVPAPSLLEKLYFPELESAFGPLKNAGIKIVWHADPNYRQILHRLIELGIDGFQGFYETRAGIRLEDLARMNATSGDPLILFGSVSTAWVLLRGTERDVEKDVERCLRVGKGRGGLLLAPSLSIGPEVPFENIRAMYRKARDGRHNCSFHEQMKVDGYPAKDMSPDIQ